MKTVFNTNEVAHIWALQQQSEGKNPGGNFYFRGATIYSYGGHFPIATIDDSGKNVLFTMRSYSNTTAKHIQKAGRAISHKNVIWCYDVPTNLKYATSEHENNFNRWKREIKAKFDELGNKGLRDTQSRINTISTHLERLTAYCEYFKIKVTDKEFKALLKTVQSDNFLEVARQAKQKQAIATANKMKLAVKAYDQYLSLWRKFDTEGMKELPVKIKDLCNFYSNHSENYTRLRFNTAQNRVETSKGVQIPVDIAKRAYIQLNGCIEGSCKDISVPVLHYTITETTKDYIKAGCHTIPKIDIAYIADLLKWK